MGDGECNGINLIVRRIDSPPGEICMVDQVVAISLSCEPGNMSITYFARCLDGRSFTITVSGT